MRRLLSDRKLAFVCVLFILVLIAATGEATTQESTAQAGWEQFTQLFDSSVQRDKIVGASVLIVSNGDILEHHEYGFADVANNRRVTEQTIFHYGSITKTLTAIAIMQLRDRDRLSLDDRATQYVPELRLVHNPYGSMDCITIRMLLSHSAGFQAATWPYKEGKPWEPFEPTSWAQLVAMMPYQEISFEPGSRYSYSNPGFIYLARITELITGDSWENYVQKNIFAPLRLSRSYFGLTPYYLAQDRSHNYTLVRGHEGKESVRDNGADFDPGITMPNSGWNAPLSDLATYLSFLANSTRGDSATQARYATVLKHSSLEEMWRPLHAIEPSKATAADQSESIGL
jgi:CubicO group peptidase (beta-lactamase class C family)